MASEDLLKKAVAAFNALSPEQQAEMLEEQRQSWVRGNVDLSRDERGMTSPVMPRPAPAATDTGLEIDIEATAENIARSMSNYKNSGRLHGPTYEVAKAAAILALTCAKVDTRSQAEELLAAERAESDEAYELGKRDGYSEAVQEIDLKTGGDGEYRYCTDHDPDRHTPDPASMIQRIVERFETLNTMESVSEINEWKKRAEKAEADNAAKDKRLKEANHV
ncbi:hypothetical protein HWD97_03665 [Ochrobactrum sp. C6C9]|uniref:hypothetical protein n=1 Tax=Ochrobactrum sp. C6C9 TaxID=2736662 RepID=UPI0035304F57|nr:hypothetical protein [Ochrobactrum sp. C6C9]